MAKITFKTAKVGQVWYIEWDDASMHDSAHWQQGTPPVPENIECKSVGFVSNITRKVIQLTQTLTEGGFANVIDIPRKMATTAILLFDKENEDASEHKKS